MDVEDTGGTGVVLAEMEAMGTFPKPRPAIVAKREQRSEDATALKRWQQAVKARDKGLCGICVDRPGMHAHHIISRRYRKTRYEVSNGVWLCQTHHEDAHHHVIAIYGWRPDGSLRWERSH